MGTIDIMFKWFKNEEILPLPGRCPATGGRLLVTELLCPDSGVTIRGKFKLGPLAQLTPEDERFLLDFIRLRGNLKAMESELKVSYPTVRARFDAVLKRIGLADGTEIGYEEDNIASLSDRRHQILDQLERKEISSEEAVKLLKDLGVD